MDGIYTLIRIVLTVMGVLDVRRHGIAPGSLPGRGDR